MTYLRQMTDFAGETVDRNEAFTRIHQSTLRSVNSDTPDANTGEQYGINHGLDYDHKKWTVDIYLLSWLLFQIRCWKWFWQLWWSDETRFLSERAPSEPNWTYASLLESKRPTSSNYYMYSLRNSFLYLFIIYILYLSYLQSRALLFNLDHITEAFIMQVQQYFTQNESYKLLPTSNYRIYLNSRHSVLPIIATKHH